MLACTKDSALMLLALLDAIRSMTSGEFYAFQNLYENSLSHRTAHTNKEVGETPYSLHIAGIGRLFFSNRIVNLQKRRAFTFKLYNGEDFGGRVLYSKIYITNGWNRESFIRTFISDYFSLINFYKVDEDELSNPKLHYVPSNHFLIDVFPHDLDKEHFLNHLLLLGKLHG